MCSGRQGSKLGFQVPQSAACLVILRSMTFRAYRQQIAHPVRAVPCTESQVMHPQNGAVCCSFSAYLTGIAVTCEHGFPQRVISIARTVLIARSLRQRPACFERSKNLRIKAAHLQHNVRYRQDLRIPRIQKNVLIPFMLKCRGKPAFRFSPVVKARLPVPETASPVPS